MIHKTISIIIPYYKEQPKQVFPLLASIDGQVGVDFTKVECILVNDGANNVFPDDFLNLFHNLDIRIAVCEENRGPGVARQIGLDNANGDYVMFCDADDVLHSVAVLGVFFDELSRSDPDIIHTPWLEELYADGKYVYISHEDEATWMHGKLLRRKFLNANNITFHPELRVHEDSYFLGIAYAMTDKRVKIPVTSYVWKYHQSSITRCNGGSYTFDSMSTYVKSIALSLAEVEKRAPSHMKYKVTQFLLYMYFSLNQHQWLDKSNNEYRLSCESTLEDVISPYIHYYDSIPLDEFRRIYTEERARTFQGSIENELFKDWFARIFIM